MRRGVVRRITWTTLAAIALACSAGPGSGPRLGGLYGRAARQGDATRNPVIVIPGILGSKLRDAESGRVVWGAFIGTYANPSRGDGARLVALPMAEGRALAELRDGVEPTGVLDRVRVGILGLPVDLQAYLYILGALGVGGYRDQDLGESGAIEYGPGHFTCFQFAYDWRRDNVENARRLHAFILAKRAYIAAQLGRPEEGIKFDLVAHSMGGLLARYYLRYGTQDLPEDGSLPPLTWAGAATVERAVLVGTPNAGAVESFVQLVEGARLSFLLPRYPPAVLGTMPSIYQLLPRARHRAVLDAADPQGGLDLFEPELWERRGWGLAAPDQEEVLEALLPDVPDPAARRRIAREHLRKSLARAERFHAALDVPAEPPPGLSLHLFAGDAERTPAVAEADGAAVRVAAWAPGDGTVLRSSALMDERVGRAWEPGLASPIRWSGVHFVFTDHLAMTRDPAFTDNLLFRLLEARD